MSLNRNGKNEIRFCLDVFIIDFAAAASCQMAAMRASMAQPVGY